MNYSQVSAMQKAHGYSDIQAQINDGSIWKMEGSSGRYAMGLLESGACMLPKKDTYDYYGNKLPNRDHLQAGTKGTFQNCARFWEKVENGTIDLNEDYD